MNKNQNLLWIFGGVLIAGGLYLLISTFTPSGYQKTTGSIAGSQEAEISTSHQRSITFTAQDGRTYTVNDRSYANKRRSSTSVTVAYNPADPGKTMRVVSDNGRSMIWGGVVLVAGVGFIYLGFRARNTAGPAIIKRRKN